MLAETPAGHGARSESMGDSTDTFEDIVARIGHHRVDDPAAFRIADTEPDSTGDLHGDADKDAAKALKKLERKRIRELQERLYAEHQQSLLVVFQATDTGGKDSTIRRVFKGVNPQGVRVWSFKQPSQEALDHDFLWRIHKRTPAKGMINVFNRSQYEDVLIVRVKNLVPEDVWRGRYELINHFEQLLTENGTRVLKFFLNISKAEQKQRFQDRLDDPEKHWKFSKADLAERKLWDDYQKAYEAAIRQCSTQRAPWYAVPANHKWYRDLVVARAIRQTLEEMDPRYPPAEQGLDKVRIPD
jgi:PPK2 family polyphosphate:nucleotide phosphotransferase